MLRHRERRQAGDWAPLDVYDGMSAVSLDLSDNYIGRRSSAVDRNAPGGSAVEGLSMQDVAKRMLLLAEKALRHLLFAPQTIRKCSLTQRRTEGE